MLRIAGQTAGSIGQNFFVDTHGWPGGVIAIKIRIFFFNIFVKLKKKFQIFFSKGNIGPFSQYIIYI